MNMFARPSMSSQIRWTRASSPGMAAISLRFSSQGDAHPAAVGAAALEERRRRARRCGRWPAAAASPGCEWPAE